MYKNYIENPCRFVLANVAKDTDPHTISIMLIDLHQSFPQRSGKFRLEPNVRFYDISYTYSSSSCGEATIISLPVCVMSELSNTVGIQVLCYPPPKAGIDEKVLDFVPLQIPQGCLVLSNMALSQKTGVSVGEYDLQNMGEGGELKNLTIAT
ncbi:hypothetical protein L211DRAFT_866911 [Terfezia boudieri ATCC MYA-4762]|uniref:Uncharacterized protein n=1 Tax=Terfezia boudieri ATCC MYA-4762 TaxID=1051890 RepID=A0A3N4LWC2_9PEZI|nr:hypothetical protein L211DRAFT_866911 [Terfezia boudieri ATCC MYA-4762]